MPPPVSKILSLPDELLAHVLELVVSYPARSWWAPDFDKFFRDGSSVVLVCRRFWRLATPYLYRHIDVAVGDTGPSFPAASSKATKHLHRTLVRNSWLREHCRTLHVYLGECHDERTQRNLRDFAIWPAETRSLLIDYLWHAGQTPDRREKAWDFVRTALRNMARLEDITLTTGTNLLTLLRIVCALSEAACPRAVTLNGVAYTGSALLWARFKERSLPIVTLHISNFQDTPENLGGFLLLAARLEKLSFTSLLLNRTKPWNLSVMATAFAPHKSSLRTLIIGSLPETSLDGFDLSDFANLQELSLSYWATGCEPGTETRLLAPRLRKFTWSFHREDQDSESYSDFQHPQATWLRGLILAAVEQRVPLDKIHIVFRPSAYVQPAEAEPREWPWDHMDRVGAEMREKGMLLSYDEPSISRQEFYRRKASP